MSVFTPKYTIPVFRSGVPTDGELLGKHIFRERVRFDSADFVLASSDVAFAAPTTLTVSLQRAGTEVITSLAVIFFDTGTTVGVGVLSDPVTAEPESTMEDGDTIRVNNDTPGDLTGADISMTFLGTRMAE